MGIGSVLLESILFGARYSSTIFRTFEGKGGKIQAAITREYLYQLTYRYTARVAEKSAPEVPLVSTDWSWGHSNLTNSPGLGVLALFSAYLRGRYVGIRLASYIS